MNNTVFKRIFQENNIMIVVPAIVVVLIIVGFIIYGVSEPRRNVIGEVDTLLIEQRNMQTQFLDEFSVSTASKTDPYVKLDPYGISPLTALIMFETTDSEAFQIVVKGKTDDADITFNTVYQSTHNIPVYGLYPNHRNIVEIYSLNTDNTIGELVTTVAILTDPVPSNLDEALSIETTYEYFGDDWMLLMPATNSLPVAYDYNGDVRWYTSIPLGFAPTMLTNGHLLVGTERILSDPYYNTGLYEIDLLGRIYNEFYIPGGYHHDAFELDNGNILVLSNDFEGTVEDIVVELDRSTGEVVKSWDLIDYLPEFDGMSAMWTTDDWFHNNSIFYDKATDSIVLSGRHQDAVISIGYTSNELNWVIGDPENWDPDFVAEYFFTPTGENFEWQYAQHDAQVLPNGDIFIFDNGNNKAKNSDSYVDASNSYSRGVIYDIDTDTMTISQVYQYGKELGSDFYSPYISNVAYYNDGHYMIHSGGISSSSIEGTLNIPAPLYDGEGEVTKSSITVEIEEDTIMYKLIVLNNYYRAGRITPSVGTKYTFETNQSLGNQAVTPIYKEEIDKKLTILESVPKEIEFTTTKYTDRLKVEGMFNRYDEIYLIFENTDNTVQYHIPTSRTAYTAMCTSTFLGDERFLTFYINEEGISGTYSVFLSINGHKYDTFEKVKFD